MKSISLQSPAKVNLDLRILGRYPNGYHKLLTLFHRISVCDTLTLKPYSRGLKILCTHPGVPLDEKNIIAKAYELVKKIRPQVPGVVVRIRKRIPVAAGLGGGSSNAAFFLIGLNKLFGLKLNRKTLMTLGAQLGADVPFFITEYSQALGYDRGDRLKVLLSKVKKYFVLISSDVGLSTREVYGALPRRLPAVSLTKLERAVRIATHFLDRWAWSEADQIFQNNLEKPAFKLQPSIQQTIQKAGAAGALLVRMSGSGPTVFAVFSSLKEAQAFAQRIKQVVKNKIIICHSY